MNLVETVDELREAVASADRVLPVGAGSKPALSTCPDSSATAVGLGSLSGFVDYDPDELTFTAKAGTPVEEIEAALSEHRQYLPFDPPLKARGATLGGTIAAGISGPGGFGAGTIRDFVIGATVVDGSGRLVSAGGRVVKNAAGFDLPKLMVGSVGRLGVLVEVSCKVFPRPQAHATVEFECDALADALAAVSALACGPVAVAALEVEPTGRVLARLDGDRDRLGDRAERLRATVDVGSRALDDDGGVWDELAELAWAPSGCQAVAIPITLAAVPALEAAVAEVDPPRRYGIGASLATLAWPAEVPLAELSAALRRLGLAGCVLTGPPPPAPLVGAAERNEFGERVRAAIDPDRRFLEIWP